MQDTLRLEKFQNDSRTQTATEFAAHLETKSWAKAMKLAFGGFGVGKGAAPYIVHFTPTKHYGDRRCDIYLRMYWDATLTITRGIPDSPDARHGAQWTDKAWQRQLGQYAAICGYSL